MFILVKYYIIDFHTALKDEDSYIKYRVVTVDYLS